MKLGDKMEFEEGYRMNILKDRRTRITFFGAVMVRTPSADTTEVTDSE